MSVICHSCATPKEAAGDRCEKCGERPSMVGEFPTLAPELMSSDDGFDREVFSRLANVEKDSFWFRGRSALILALAKRHFAHAAAIAEIGCGNGAVLSAVAKSFPDASLTAMDAHVEALSEARIRLGAHARILQGDARALPFDNEFDLLGAFDVIEHIEQDRKALENFQLALKPGGGLLISVPAHMMLWSSADDFSHHFRRYERSEIISKVEDAGFDILEVANFVSLLLPALFVQRLFSRSRPVSKPQVRSLLPPFGLNGLFSAIMAFERMMILSGAGLPFGGSLLVAARKPSNSQY